MDFTKFFDSNAEFILCKLFNCDKYELRLLETVTNESLLMDSIQSTLQFYCGYNDNLVYPIMESVFSGKLTELEDIRYALIDELLNSGNDKELLEVYKTKPFTDISYICEKDNISIYFVANANLYKKYFKDWIKSVAKDTGYSIGVKL